HQIKEGSADQSYGIQVAKLAGLPDALIERATAILTELEEGAEHEPVTERMEAGQLSFFIEENSPEKENKLTKKEQQVIDDLGQLNLFEMTPMEAMNALYQLQKKL